MSCITIYVPNRGYSWPTHKVEAWDFHFHDYLFCNYWGCSVGVQLVLWLRIMVSKSILLLLLFQLHSYEEQSWSGCLVLVARMKSNNFLNESPSQLSSRGWLLLFTVTHQCTSWGGVTWHTQPATMTAPVLLQDPLQELRQWSGEARPWLWSGVVEFKSPSCNVLTSGSITKEPSCHQKHLRLPGNMQLTSSPSRFPSISMEPCEYEGMILRKFSPKKLADLWTGWAVVRCTKPQLRITS